MAATLHPELIMKLTKDFIESLTKEVYEEEYPFLKKCLFLKNKLLYMERDYIYEKNGVHFKYMNTEYDEKISAIHIATNWTGRILSYSHSTKTWFNLYDDNASYRDILFSKDKYYASPRTFFSWEDALKYRDYQKSDGEYLMDNKFTESPFLIDHIIATLTELDK